MTSGYQPKKMIKVSLCGHELSRPEPIHPDSLRCKFGFHDLKPFELDDEFVSVVIGKPPRYCSCCNYIEGCLVPPRPKHAQPTVTKIDPSSVTKGKLCLNITIDDADIEKAAEKLAREAIDKAIQEQVYGKPPKPPKAPTPPSARVIRESSPIKAPGEE